MLFKEFFTADTSGVDIPSSTLNDRVVKNRNVNSEDGSGANNHSVATKLEFLEEKKTRRCLQEHFFLASPTSLKDFKIFDSLTWLTSHSLRVYLISRVDIINFLCIFLARLKTTAQRERKV